MINFSVHPRAQASAGVLIEWHARPASQCASADGFVAQRAPLWVLGADSRLELFRELTAAPPPESSWEVGASCNFMIAASRLGLRVGCAGHCGDDIYGDFLRSILAVGALPTECIFEDMYLRLCVLLSMSSRDRTLLRAMKHARADDPSCSV